MKTAISTGISHTALCTKLSFRQLFGVAEEQKLSAPKGQCRG